MNVEDDRVGNGSQSELLDAVLGAGSEVEQLAVKSLSSFRLAQDDKVGLLMCSMFVRCLNFFRAVRYLSRQRLSQPAAACVRSLIEQRWVLESVACESTRAESLRRLAEHDEHNRKRGLDNLRDLGQDERDHRITDEWLDEVEAELDPARSKTDLKKWAELANQRKEYLTTYALLCNMTHPSLGAVENHLLFNADGRVLSVTAKSGGPSLSLHVIQACEVMIDVIATCTGAWRMEEVTNHANDLRHRLSELLERVPDQLIRSEPA